MLAGQPCAAALFLVVLSLVNQALTRGGTRKVQQMQMTTMSMLGDAKRNSEAAAAMSMGDDLCKRWGAGYVGAISHARDMADNASMFGAMSKAARLVLQSGMLALGAFLVIDADMSPGGMMASSIILARALSPIDQVLAYSMSTTSAWQSFKRLRTLLPRFPRLSPSSTACRVQRRLTVRDIAIVPPGWHSADRRRCVVRDRGWRRARHHRPQRLRQVDARSAPSSAPGRPPAVKSASTRR